MNKVYLLTFFLYLGCSATQSSVSYPIEDKQYKNHKVSVQAAVDIAMSAYLKGCSDKAKVNGEKGFFNKCVKDARKHVNKHVIGILDQGTKK